MPTISLPEFISVMSFARNAGGNKHNARRRISDLIHVPMPLPKKSDEVEVADNHSPHKREEIRGMR